MISVIVPVYNVEKYIEKCLDSILCQSYSELEILVVDDESTDGSGAICDRYTKKDSRFQIYHKKHGGLSEARNFGLRHAAGEYVAFVDGDDFIDEDMYEELLRGMDEFTDIVTCGINNFFPAQMHVRNTVSYKAHTYTEYSNCEAVRELFFSKVISFSSCDKLIRKRLFDGILYPKGKICEDLPVVYRLVTKSRKVVNIGKSKYNYVYRADSISRKPFYPGKMHYVLFSKDILSDIIENYSGLKKEATAWYINNVITVLENIADSSEPEQCASFQIKLNRILLRYIIEIYINPYIPEERKHYYFEFIKKGRYYKTTGSVVFRWNR